MFSGVSSSKPNPLGLISIVFVSASRALMLPLVQATSSFTSNRA